MSPLVDANILLYAKFADYPQHATARQWLEAALSAPDPVALPWLSLTAFVRLATNRRLFENPLPPTDAMAEVQGWLARPNVWTPEPGPRFSGVFAGLIDATQASGNLVTDAWLAALALEHGLTVVSSDADFGRFPRLSWSNPLTD